MVRMTVHKQIYVERSREYSPLIIEEILGTSQREIGEPGSGNYLAIALVLAALALVTITVAVSIGVGVSVSMESGESDSLSVLVLILEELQRRPSCPDYCKQFLYPLMSQHIKFVFAKTLLHSICKCMYRDGVVN